MLGQEHPGGRRGRTRFGVLSLSRSSTLPGQRSLHGDGRRASKGHELCRRPFGLRNSVEMPSTDADVATSGE